MTNAKRRTTARKSSRTSSRRSYYGSAFFAVLAITVASTIGFFGLVASVLAGS